ncbi:hypothetical protein PENSPDRAFT_656816 [Peniophora sp. CONT]|nr:hypothetical protein PENSPDRAFT_656816 [Peniophora sp. CONT]
MTVSSPCVTATYDREAMIEDFRRVTRAALGPKTQSPAKPQIIHVKPIPSLSVEWSERIWNWLSRPNHADAVAPCLAAEVIDMDEVIPKNKSATYYRLGRVPCMHASLVGILVGLIIYEKRIIYYVDDGTAVVECAVRYEGDSRDPYALPTPAATEGDHVRVKGKVVSLRDGKGLTNAVIERCRSEADVLQHRRLVKGLYRQRYEDSTPFQIPNPIPMPAPTVPAQKAEDPQEAHQQPSYRPVAPQQPQPGPSTIFPRTPSKNRTRAFPVSPALSEISAYTASAAGSPTKTPRTASSHQLRHPTRIRRQDTTTALFRTYLMHYITHGPSRSASQEESDDEFGFEEIIKTPTKRRPLTDLTPRPNKRLHLTPPSTPRASALPSSTSMLKEPETTECGVTMSHLRRVPELALLASKLHRHLSEEHASQSRHHTEPAKVKIKRLFTKTLIDLHKRGSIIIMGSEGPVHPLPERGRGWDREDSRLWKASSGSGQTQGGDVSRASTRRTQEPDLDDLSDAEDGEEAYVACNARLLAAPVLSVLKSLTAKGSRTAHSRRGPTTARITEALKRRDDRWTFMGDLQVEEALQLLQSERRARKDASGTWTVL